MLKNVGQRIRLSLCMWLELYSYVTIRYDKKKTHLTCFSPRSFQPPARTSVSQTCWPHTALCYLINAHKKVSSNRLRPHTNISFPAWERPTDVHTPVAFDLTREELRRTTGQNGVLWSVFPTPPSERDGQRRIRRSSGPFWRSTNRSESSRACTSETQQNKMDTMCVHPYRHITVYQRNKPSSHYRSETFIFKYNNERSWICFQVFLV